MSSASNLLSAFNDHFFEFVEDVQNVFPDDTDVTLAKNGLFAIRKANPKLLVRIWQQCIVGKYLKEIEEGDMDFFINKDYAGDLTQSPYAGQIVEAINRLRQPIREKMSRENQIKSMKYIQNLTKLSTMYCSMA